MVDVAGEGAPEVPIEDLDMKESDGGEEVKVNIPKSPEAPNKSRD